MGTKKVHPHTQKIEPEQTEFNQEMSRRKKYMKDSELRMSTTRLS